MRKRTVKLWRLHDDGRKLYAGTIEAADPRELVIKWSAFLATAERGVYFATYRGSFIAPEAALESDDGALRHSWHLFRRAHRETFANARARHHPRAEAEAPTCRGLPSMDLT